MEEIKKNIGEFSFDHVGIAVKSIEESLVFYEAMGLKSTHFEEVKSEGVKVAMLELDNNSRLELLEPIDGTGPVQKFLDKRGPGIHHICLRVDDIVQVLDNLKQAGVRLINDEPKKGAHNMLVAFVHPKSTDGVLLEISQKNK